MKTVVGCWLSEEIQNPKSNIREIRRGGSRTALQEIIHKDGQDKQDIWGKGKFVGALSVVGCQGNL